MISQKIRIKLKSFDHNLIDKSAEKIVKAVKTTGGRGEWASAATNT
jgi:small subunit ribosomal protein S10